MRKFVILLFWLLCSSSTSYAANYCSDEWSFTIVFDDKPPVITNRVPAPDAIGITRVPEIIIQVADYETGIDINSIELLINGIKVTPQIEGAKNEYTVKYVPIEPFYWGQRIIVNFKCNDIVM